MINEERRKIQLEVGDILEKNNFNGFVILPTGTGKGNILVEALKKINPKKAIYLCDSENNRDKTFKEELIKWDAGEWVDRIQFECYQTARKFKNQEFDLALCDEADFSMTPQYSKFYKNNKVKHLILVSATLLDEKRLMAESIVPILYETNIQDIEDKGVLNQAEYTFVNFFLTPEENRKYLIFNDQIKKLYDKKENSTTESEKKKVSGQIDFIVNQRTLFLKGLESSKKVCKTLLKKVYTENENNKILVFCGLTEQADAICKYSYHSKNVKDNWLEKFDNDEIRVCSVVGKVDRGMNINGVNNIIFESPYKSKTKFVQKSGRGRRLAVDDILHVYFLIPFYKTRRGDVRATVVEKWVLNSTSDVDLSNVKQIFV